MSRELYAATEGHLHSPVDDLESFFWVAVWSVFFNKDDTGPKSATEEGIQDDLAQGHKDRAMGRLSALSDPKTRDKAVRVFRPILSDWWEKVRLPHKVWNEKVIDRTPEGAGKEYFLPHFHQFALQGVVDVLELLEKYKDSQINRESWEPPAPSM